MRTIGQQLHGSGFHVVGLRIPGHGTAPSGLLKVTWQDFTAATRLAARHVREKIGPDKPLYFAGYSNGAALAVENRLLAGFVVDDFFPQASDLPEGLTDLELEAVYGGVHGERYRAMIGEIDARLKECGAYQ